MLSNFEISLPENKYMHRARVHPSEVESLGREKFVLPTDKFMKRTSDLHLLLSLLIYEQRHSRNPRSFRYVFNFSPTLRLTRWFRDVITPAIRAWIPRIDTGSEHVVQFVSFHRSNDRNRKLETFLLFLLYFRNVLIIKTNFCKFFAVSRLIWGFSHKTSWAELFHWKFSFLLQSVNAHKYQGLLYVWI